MHHGASIHERKSRTVVLQMWWVHVRGWVLVLQEWRKGRQHRVFLAKMASSIAEQSVRIKEDMI